jgi:kinesin family protein C1
MSSLYHPLDAVTPGGPGRQGRVTDASEDSGYSSHGSSGPRISEYFWEIFTKMKSSNNLLREENMKLNANVVSLQQDLAKSRTNELLLEKSKKQTSKFKEELEHYRMKSDSAEQTLQNTKLELDQQLLTLDSLNRQIDALQRALGEKENQISQMDVVITEGQMVRRKLHNCIQELKGNIRVYCRVRPSLPNEDEDSAIRCRPDGSSVDIRSAGASPKSFQFDKVFSPAATNADVFDEISQLVQSALDGYRVCIFAYGQTGSGKTYTMEGPARGTASSRMQDGMIPQAVNQLFESAEKLKPNGWTFSLSAQFLEIYNEAIRDLLDTTPPSKDFRASGASINNKAQQKAPQKIEIKHDPQSRLPTVVTGVAVVPVSEAATVQELLVTAAKNRSSAATNANEHSSRSHSVFTIFIEGNNLRTNEHTVGVLNLIDLAGSERLQHSGSTGDRLKETQHINKSLSCLGDVIHALSHKTAHIPFRNSKLTYL